MTLKTRANESNKRSGEWVTQARNRLAARREEKPVTKRDRFKRSGGRSREPWPMVRV